MAARFWVGETGTWDATDTTHWSATTGGAGGASVPTTADTITFNASSGGGTCTVAATGAGTSMTCTGYTGTFSGTQLINLNAASGAIFTAGGSIEAGSNITIVLTNNAASGSRTFNGGTGGEANSFSLSLSAGQAGCNVAITTGTGVRDVTIGAGYVGAIANNTRTIYGNLTVASATVAFTAGANVVTFAATSAKTITTNSRTLDFPMAFNGVGGQWTFADALTQGSTRAFTITNGTVKLKAGVTSTVGAFATSGATTKSLQSTSAGSAATVSQASGTVNASYLIIQDSTATGGATWNATNSVDQGGNTGWFIYATDPSVQGVGSSGVIQSFLNYGRI